MFAIHRHLNINSEFTAKQHGIFNVSNPMKKVFHICTRVTSSVSVQNKRYKNRRCWLNTPDLSMFIELDKSVSIEKQFTEIDSVPLMYSELCMCQFDIQHTKDNRKPLQ